MQRTVPLVLLLLGAILVAGCGSGDEGGLTVSPNRIDFGRMMHGDVSERTLTLANRGAADVTIRSTSFNCACFELHPFGKLLHPGEERTLTVRFLSGEVGPGSLRGKHLDLLSTDRESPLLQVDLEGEIVRSLTVLPPTIDLGVLGTPPSLEGQVVRVRPGPGMEVELVRHRVQPEAALDAEIVPMDGGFDVSVRWQPSAEGGPGRFLGALEIRTRVTGAGFDTRELEHVVRIQGEWPPR